MVQLLKIYWVNYYAIEGNVSTFSAFIPLRFGIVLDNFIFRLLNNGLQRLSGVPDLSALSCAERDLRVKVSLGSSENAVKTQTCSQKRS